MIFSAFLDDMSSEWKGTCYIHHLFIILQDHHIVTRNSRKTFLKTSELLQPFAFFLKWKKSCRSQQIPFQRAYSTKACSQQDKLMCVIIALGKDCHKFWRLTAAPLLVTSIILTPQATLKSFFLVGKSRTRMWNKVSLFTAVLNQETLFFIQRLVGICNKPFRRSQVRSQY